jgi:hypothetical protein
MKFFFTPTSCKTIPVHGSTHHQNGNPTRSCYEVSNGVNRAFTRVSRTHFEHNIRHAGHQWLLFRDLETATAGKRTQKSSDRPWAIVCCSCTFWGLWTAPVNCEEGSCGCEGRRGLQPSREHSLSGRTSPSMPHSFQELLYLPQVLFAGLSFHAGTDIHRCGAGRPGGIANILG